MMRERGLDVDHSTVFRWVQRYAPETNKRTRQHLKMSGTSYRVAETYIKVGKTCKYLYRAGDKEGQIKKLMRAEQRRLPFSISVEKNAAYPEAFSASRAEKIVPKDCRLRRVKYLNECDGARPPFHEKEGASVAALQEFSHRGANTRRH